MTTSIKITALTDIGANIAYTTLVPVVNMGGTPTTEKANLQIVGNLILNGAGGSYFPAAAEAILAQTVSNAAQPNITSVGTLTGLTVTGNSSLGNVSAGNLVSANYFSGTLTTASQPNITSLGNLASLTVTGNITANNVTVGNIVASNLIEGANLFSSTNNNYINLDDPAVSNAVGIHSQTTLHIITDDGNVPYIWNFDQDGDLVMPLPGKLYFGNSNEVDPSNVADISGARIILKDLGANATAFPTSIGVANTGAWFNIDDNTKEFSFWANTTQVGSLTGSGDLTINGNISALNAVVWVTAPVSNTALGSPGQAAYDGGGNLYVCVTTNTWAKFTGTTSW